MTWRSDVVIQRPGVGLLETDPALIGDHPNDWATVQYMLSIGPDPLDPSRPKTIWVPITLLTLDGGYGVYGTY